MLHIRGTVNIATMEPGPSGAAFSTDARCAALNQDPVMPHAPNSTRRPSSWRRRRARRVLPAMLLVLAAFAGPSRSAAQPALQPAPVTLFTFDRADEAEWDVVNDGVMGGRSAGFVAVEQGTLRFTGTLVTQGGGFTSVRARRAVDLTGQLGIELRVRSSGRQFEVELDDGVRAYGRTVSRRAPFATSAEWTVVRVPFSALRSTIFGRAVNAPPIDVARIRGLGLYMADGQDGPFRLEVDWVRSYGAGDE
jgi:NADH dehydrogenase [ubiquinone] 1 alpha subcomplex assembly factor 1